MKRRNEILRNEMNINVLNQKGHNQQEHKISLDRIQTMIEWNKITKRQMKTCLQN